MTREAQTTARGNEPQIDLDAIRLEAQEDLVRQVLEAPGGDFRHVEAFRTVITDRFAEANRLLFEWLSRTNEQIAESYLSGDERQSQERIDAAWNYCDPDEFKLAQSTRQFMLSFDIDPYTGASIEKEDV